VKNSHILWDSKKTPGLITDVLLVKNKFLVSRKDDLVKLAKGWLIANEDINASIEEKSKAAQILSHTLKIPIDEAESSISEAYLCSRKNNKVFLGLQKSDSTPTTGQSIYEKWSEIYNRLNYSPANVLPWDSLLNRNFLKEVLLAK
jgi:hypothetical protein